MAGAFLSQRRPIWVKWLSYENHLALLKQRGLTVGDPEQAKRLLQHIGYYRLSEYLRYWQKNPEYGDNTFVGGASFMDICAVHEAEARLADVTMVALRRIEPLLRAQFADTFSEVISPYALLTDKAAFTPPPSRSSGPTAQEALLRDLNRSKEAFVSRYRDNSERNERGEYKPEAYAQTPAWVAVQACSFGTLSRCLEASGSNTVRDIVADRIHTGHSQIASQVKSLVYLRNWCAHSARIWNHSCLEAPPLTGKVAAHLKKRYRTFNDRSAYKTLSLIHLLLASNSYCEDWLGEQIEPILQGNDLLACGITAPQKYQDFTP
ncbi:Abi family protein [Actinomyces timonensis]|uniref:Abi family protein n=1 Tax=Actinomyces timonensis TaxID=1288391 RepID=A0AAU8N3L8_9ACTO